jgi:predicted DNA-binding transcriptional regulator AlpA
MLRSPRPLPGACSTGQLEDITGLAATTIRRLAKDEQDFPKPFVLEPDGDFRWNAVEVVAWIGRRALRPLEPSMRRKPKGTAPTAASPQAA